MSTTFDAFADQIMGAIEALIKTRLAAHAREIDAKLTAQIKRIDERFVAIQGRPELGDVQHMAHEILVAHAAARTARMEIDRIDRIIRERLN